MSFGFVPISSSLLLIRCPPQIVVMDGHPSPAVVGVGLCDSASLLWRVEDLRAVRSQGLVGALLGSLPRTPRQNARRGRPLLLLPEEEELLTERHAAAPGGQVSPPADNQFSEYAGQHGPQVRLISLCCQQGGGGVELRLQVQQHQEDQQRSYEEQSILALEDRKSALLRAMTSSHTGKTP